MIPALKRFLPKAAASPIPAALVARVATASAVYLDASRRQREGAALRSVQVLTEVFDACRTRAALEELDRRAGAGFTVWIPDAAIDLIHCGREDEGVKLLARLGETLGQAPFSRELLIGMAKGMRRWCSRGGEFEIDLSTQELAEVVMRLVSEAGSPSRREQLSAVLGRPVDEWHEGAAELLSGAGPVALGNGMAFVTMPFSFGEESGWEKVSPAPRVGRNQPCPCGSGRKFKRCCGRAQEVA